ncbi:hypothetical protein CIL05_00145 [Virgibacillus profundi]|uniref:Sodium-dependent dicarboxylate transporter SdcS n=1 Tax=Virgibacillus profundi TaxID=2024555 RepID=A0A2A2IJ32_9BACI|nr:SLC13 family permease [Virgibacillus profundi]PAV31105.1 hypothetical protein CIL05_00145 [Virgibacillus profundi]PXY55288.1 citrate:succinate antiporter [Virgibacillus profundi]
MVKGRQPVKIMKKNDKIKTKYVLLVCMLIVYIIFLTPLFFTFDLKTKSIAILIISQVLWLGKVFPVAYTSIIVILVMSIHVTTFDKTIGYLGSEVVWLFFSTFIITGAIIKSNIINRISLHLLKWSHGNIKFIIFISYVIFGFLALLVPSNIGRIGITSSFAVEGIIKNVKNQMTTNNLAAGLMIAMSYIVLITGGLVITSSNSSIYTLGILKEETSINWTYLSWLSLTSIPIVIFMLGLFAVIMWLFPIENISTNKLQSYIQNQITENGSWKKSEKKIAFIIILTVLLWITEPVHGYSIAMIGMFSATLTIFPGTGIWNWEAAKEIVNWDLIIFFATSLALASMLLDSGAIQTIAEKIVLLTNFIENSWLLLVIIAVFSQLLRLFFINVLGYMVIMIPMALKFGEFSELLSPSITVMVVFMVGMPGFFLIMQSPVNILSYQYGYFSQRDLFKAGMLAAPLWILVVIIVSIFLWPAILSFY